MDKSPTLEDEDIPLPKRENHTLAMTSQLLPESFSMVEMPSINKVLR